MLAYSAPRNGECASGDSKRTGGGGKKIILMLSCLNMDSYIIDIIFTINI
jgi:hypothetical protein